LGKLAIMEKALAYIAGYGGKVYLIVQDITQLNSVYGKDNALMANCHVRIAYAPNTIETANTLSEMTGKTTVVDEKMSLSGSRSGGMKNASISVSETARPLLTPDECMRLPGPVKDNNGRIVKPGDMLIFTAGKPPVYGRQMLYFLDPVFAARSKITPPGISPAHASGISDSLYFTLPLATAPAAIPAAQATKQGGSYAEYFQ
jgi:type IV secretion system protein VirD4